MTKEQSSEYDLATGLLALLSGGACTFDNDGTGDVTVVTPTGWQPATSFYGQWNDDWCIYADEIEGLVAEGFVEVDSAGLPAITSRTREAAQAFVTATVLVARE